MQTVCLIFLPWIVFGLLSMVGWWSVGINIAISFVIEGIYFFSLVIIENIYSKEDDDEQAETALERARRVIG